MAPALPILLLAALAAGPPADVSFRQSVSSAVDGAPTGPVVVSRVYRSGSRMRLESGDPETDPVFLLQLDADAAYLLDPVAHVATRLDAESLRARSQIDLAMAGDLMGGNETRVRTTTLPGIRTLARHACRGFRISAGTAVLEVWVTQELPIGVAAFADLLDWTGAAQALGGLADAIRDLPGFPLETRSRVTVLGHVHETLATITEVKLGPLPASLFEVPAGYRVERGEEEE